MRKKIQTDKAPAAIGPYSQAIQVGNMVYSSGQIPLNPATGQMAEGDIRVQTRQVLRNLAAVLESAGSGLTHIVKTTVFVTDLKQFAALNEEYEKMFQEVGVDVFPARSTVEVAALPKGSQVEIEAIALTK